MLATYYRNLPRKAFPGTRREEVTEVLNLKLDWRRDSGKVRDRVRRLHPGMHIEGCELTDQTCEHCKRLLPIRAFGGFDGCGECRKVRRETQGRRESCLPGAPEGKVKS